MPYHLKDNTINKEGKESVDKDILNSALELGYSFFFPKKSLCSLKVKDVFDGNNILGKITRGKSTVNTSPALDTFLKQHIQYLRDHYSIEQNAPLFPGYEGESGERKLHRHIKKYSIYWDIHDLTNKSYQNLYNILSNNGHDFNKCLSEISRITGKSARTIKKSLTPSQQLGTKIKHYDTLKETWESRERNINKFILIDEAVPFLSESDALDEHGAEIWIKRSFSLFDSQQSKKLLNNDDVTVRDCKYKFIQKWRNRVKEIEKGLIGKREENKVQLNQPCPSPFKEEGEENKDLGEKPAKRLNYAQLIEEAIEDNKVQRDKKAKIATQAQPILADEIQPTAEMINKEIEELFADIQRVKKKVPSEK